MDIAAFATNMSVPAIAVIAFFVGLCVKRSPLDDKWIPCIVGGVGAILGVVGLYTLPDFPVNNVLAAIAVGICSGLAATGGHQIYKQLTGEQDKPPNEGNVTVYAYEDYYEGNPVGEPIYEHDES